VIDIAAQFVGADVMQKDARRQWCFQQLPKQPVDTHVVTVPFHHPIAIAMPSAWPDQAAILVGDQTPHDAFKSVRFHTVYFDAEAWGSC